MGEATLKDHILLDSMCMKWPEQAGLQRQEVGQWLPRSRGRRVTSDEFSFFWGPDENVLKLDGSDGCTTLNILYSNIIYSEYIKHH